MKKKDKEQEKVERTMTLLFRVPKEEVTKKLKKKRKKGKD